MIINDLILKRKDGTINDDILHFGCKDNYFFQKE